jgi:lipid A 3-O-deacylase
MNKKKTAWCSRTLCSMVFAALGLASASASADQFGVQVAGGVADHDMKKGDLGFVWDPNLTWWEIGGFHFALVGEAHLAFWHSTADNAVNKNIVEAGITPVFRFIKSSGLIRPYFEAGVGVRVISHPRITENYTMSSAFQFADMVGVGAAFGEHQNYQAGFRFQHLSNAGIKHPNPGIDFSQLYLQYNF